MDRYCFLRREGQHRSLGDYSCLLQAQEKNPAVTEIPEIPIVDIRWLSIMGGVKWLRSRSPLSRSTLSTTVKKDTLALTPLIEITPMGIIRLKSR